MSEDRTRTAISSKIYKPLEPGFIRLLHLQPAWSLEAPLAANLQPVLLGANVQYEALSYAWGGAFDDQPLPDGQLNLEGTLVSITGNLRDALRRLRRMNKRRTVWVDAVCINQDDLPERAAQVAIMAQIYSTASQVIVWFGEDSPEGDGRAFMNWYRAQRGEHYGVYSRELLSALRNPWFGGDAGRRWLDDLDILYPMFTWRPGRQMKLMRLFMRRRYLSRMWCVQEIAFAKDISILCGCQELPSASLENPETGWPALRPFRSLQSFLGDGRGVLGILADCQGLSCQDERDRIYGLASLMKMHPDCPEITIDYTEGWTEVYTQFACNLLLKGSLSVSWQVLVIAAKQLSSRSPKRSSELPSWVPDWNVVSRTQYYAEEITDNDKWICDGITLSLRLAFFGTILPLEDEDGIPAQHWCRPDDCLYGLPTDQQSNYLEPGNTLILRSVGENEPSFRIVGILEMFAHGRWLFGGRRMPVVAVHYITIR